MNDENCNAIVSPYCLGQALAMLANGAVGETYDKISRALNLGKTAPVSEYASLVFSNTPPLK